MYKVINMCKRRIPQFSRASLWLYDKECKSPSVTLLYIWVPKRLCTGCIWRLQCRKRYTKVIRRVVCKIRYTKYPQIEVYPTTELVPAALVFSH
jgi:hypothetical protein